MKTFFISSLLLLSGTALFAQGIKFEEGDWASVVAKAKKEKRLIYVDAYTTWCGPCKMLAANIFPQKEAGDYYNAKFVNYRVDAEKGEGITLAKKYNVTGYPTHLFIEPAGGNVVYRGSGYSPEVSHFVHEGEVAGLEWKDPMTLDKYNSQFAAKQKDKAFLKSYLQKTDRLGKNNDDVLNAYVATLDPKKLSDEEVIFLQQNIRSLDNNAVAIVRERNDVFGRKYPDQPDYLNNVSAMWINGTYEKAVATKNEGLLGVMDASLKASKPDKAQEEMFFWRSRYYNETGNKEGAAKAAMEEASYLMSKSPDQYAQDDAAALEEIKGSMRSQLKMMKVPEDKMEEAIKKNLESQPALMHSASVQAAQKLNSSAWNVYENNAKDAALVRQALPWAKKALELSGTAAADWSPVADTYAHLLFVSGSKDEAIRLEQQALDKLKAAGSTETADYEQELAKMKAGSL